MSGTIGNRFTMPYPQEVDVNGIPLSGGLLYFYASGTSTPLVTYSDSGLTVPNPNPVVAASDGVWPNIFMTAAAYKVILTTSGGTQIWTADPVVNYSVVVSAAMLPIVTAATLNDAVTLLLADLPTTLPGTTGVWWINGGVMMIS